MHEILILILSLSIELKKSITIINTSSHWLHLSVRKQGERGEAKISSRQTRLNAVDER